MIIRAPWRPPKGTPTRLLVLRHGEVDENHRSFLYGQLDVPLSERGRLQSIRCGEAFSGHQITAVYTSDLSRARFLGEQIARHHGLQPQVEVRLRERHFGHWQGLSWGEIEERFPDEVARYVEDRTNYRVPGDSENFRDVRNRVVPFLREVVHRHPEQSIVITAHSGPTRLILSEYMAFPIESMFTFEQNYCCLNIIDIYSDGRSRVQVLNATHHLGDLFC